MTHPTVEAASVPAAFHAAYRVLSTLFLPPDDDRLATLVVATPELRLLTSPIEELSVRDSWRTVLDLIEGLDDAQVAELRADHTALFLSGSRDRSVQPYESAHVAVPDHAQPMVSAAVATTYRNAGLVVTIRGELPDHVAIELEFLAHLCHLEGDAVGGEIDRWRRERDAFLTAHALRWFGRFAESIDASSPGSAYGTIAGTAHRLVEDDALLLDVLLAAGAPAKR